MRRTIPIFILFGVGAIAAESDLKRLDREQLLEYQDASGRRQEVKSWEDWQRRRDEILAGMESVTGAFPSDTRRVALEVKVDEEVAMGTYVRRLISYQSELGSRTPAYLCIPSSLLSETQKVARAPAVLCLHPTDHKEGHRVVVGLGGKERRQYAAELAERGYVTISPAYPLMANYQPDLKRLGYQSGTMKAIWDNSRSLDVLESLEFVDESGGFGVIGHSLGGHNAIFTAVFDRRLKVIVSSCGFDSFLDYYGGAEEKWRLGQGWCQTRYMPRLAQYQGRLRDIPFDFHELIGALAPRRLFISAPKRDSNFHWRSVAACCSAARAVYQLTDSAQQMGVAHPDSDHDFPDAIRDQAYRTIDSGLNPK
ncbi:MAG: alpha/beta hydrolase [Verrucomicrobiales bacterium]